MNRIIWDSNGIKFFESLIDILFIISAYLASLLILSPNILNEIISNIILTAEFIFTLSFIIFLNIIFFKTYKTSITQRTFLGSTFRISLSLLMTTIIILLASFIYMNYGLPRLAIVIMFPLQLFLIAIIKNAEFRFLKKYNVKTTLLFGPKEEVEKLAEKILDDDNKYLHLKYLFFDNYNKSMSEIININDYLKKVDYLYITEGVSNDKKNYLVSLCYKIKKKFYVVPKLYELAIRNSKPQQIGDILLYEPRLIDLTLFQRFIKRTFDLVISIIVLFFLSPIMLFIGLAIKFYDKGPIFLKQERITRNNHRFILLKFRTMIPNAEKKTGPVLASDEDPRITKIGKFLRKTRIDELPQLINIIKGDMSIVGPRPEREYFINQFKVENSDYIFRLNVKSGVTGLAQALGTYNTDFNEKLRFDIYYITNYSFLTDLYILLHTIRSIFDPKSSKGIEKHKRISMINLDDANNFSKLQENIYEIKTR